MPKNNDVNADIAFRLNRAIDFIDDNLESNISVKQLSDIACFSESHFHRLFQTLTGQSPGFFIKRRRMAKSLFILINRKSLAISTIAEMCGYSTISNFSKVFSLFYGVSPSKVKSSFNPHNIKQFNTTFHRDFGNTRLKLMINTESLSRYQANFRNILNDDVYDKLYSRRAFSTKRIDNLTYVYSRTFGMEPGENIHINSKKHFSYYADIKKIYSDAMTISVHLDATDYTPPQYYRHDAGITVPENTDEYKHLNRKNISSGLYATISLELPLSQCHYIWVYLVAEWIPSTFYELDARPAFCEYRLIPDISPSEKLQITYYLPIHIC